MKKFVKQVKKTKPSDEVTVKDFLDSVEGPISVSPDVYYKFIGDGHRDGTIDSGSQAPGKIDSTISELFSKSAGEFPVNVPELKGKVENIGSVMTLGDWLELVSNKDSDYSKYVRDLMSSSNGNGNDGSNVDVLSKSPVDKLGDGSNGKRSGSGGLVGSLGGVLGSGKSKGILGGLG